jgi:hypothetical protein
MIASVFALTLAALGSASCPLPEPRAGTELHYDTMKGFVVTAGDDALLTRFAPIILVEDYENTYNRVGNPSAKYDDDGEEVIYVDSETPVYYTQIIEWDGENGHYRNLIYRVHFEKSLANGQSTDGGAGENVGLMVFVTIDEQDRPIFVNAVHTCACFHALFPTTFTPPSEYPEGWKDEEHDVWGESLPARLRYPEDFGGDVRPVVFLRDGSHRVADAQVASIASVRERYELFDAVMKPADALRHLPLGDGETSFYYEEGKNKGLVKGAYKRKEAMLLGLVTGDGRVGQDRMYGSEDEVPRGFYTSINPLKKGDSGMWDYAAFLKENGWRP